MKYFEKIPKVLYETTAGSFSISTPYAYYDFPYDLIQTQYYNIDSKNTLIEAASTIYQDPNSFWVFLLSNNTANSFTLIPKNIQIDIEENKNKLTFNLEGSTAGQYIIVGKRTILMEYDTAAGSGDPTTFSGTGYFDYQGNYALVESIDPFTKKVRIKQTEGTGEWDISVSSTDNLSALNDTGTAYLNVSDLDLTTENKTTYKDTVKKSITPDTGNVVVDAQYENISEAFTAVGQNEESYTEEDLLKDQPKQIKAFLPSELNKVLGTLVYIKYS